MGFISSLFEFGQKDRHKSIVLPSRADALAFIHDAQYKPSMFFDYQFFKYSAHYLERGLLSPEELHSSYVSSMTDSLASKGVFDRGPVQYIHGIRMSEMKDFVGQSFFYVSHSTSSSLLSSRVRTFGPFSLSFEEHSADGQSTNIGPNTGPLNTFHTFVFKDGLYLGRAELKNSVITIPHDPSSPLISPPRFTDNIDLTLNVNGHRKVIPLSLENQVSERNAFKYSFPTDRHDLTMECLFNILPEDIVRSPVTPQLDEKIINYLSGVSSAQLQYFFSSSDNGLRALDINIARELFSRNTFHLKAIEELLASTGGLTAYSVEKLIKMRQDAN